MDKILINSLHRSIVWATLCVFVSMATSLLSPLIFTKFRKDFDSKLLNEWCNRNTSSFHAAFITFVSYYYFLFVNHSRNIGEVIDDYQAFSIDIMLGYLWYDLLSETFVFRTSGYTQTVLHHVIGILSHYATRLSNCGAAGYYSILIHTAEVSTPLLHYGWLGVKYGYTKYLSFQLYVLFETIVFFLCRCVLGPFMLYHILTNSDKWGNYQDGYIYWFSVCVVAFFVVLNYYWMFLIIQVIAKQAGKSE